MIDIAVGVVVGLALARLVGLAVLFAWTPLSMWLLGQTSPMTRIPAWWRFLDWAITGRDPLGWRDGR